MRQQTDPNGAAKKIFNPTGKTYLYSHAALFRYSEEYNRVVGHISTGSREEDAKLMNEPVHVGGSIEDMLKLFRNGVEFHLRDPKDFPEIYDLVCQHLNNWIAYINNDPNVKGAPLETLQLMEEFAASIYSQAVGYRPNLKVPPRMAKRSKLMFGGISREQADKNAPPKEQPKHRSMFDKLEGLLAERNAGPSNLTRR
jgi:hypothetical protein